MAALRGIGVPSARQTSFKDTETGLMDVKQTPVGISLLNSLQKATTSLVFHILTGLHLYVQSRTNNRPSFGM